MKLYILTGSWTPWYDKVFGFVVRANNEKTARAIASQESGDEGSQVWLDEHETECKELTLEGEPGVILRDFASA